VSAWQKIVSKEHTREWLTLCEQALDEIQAETSRRNAERIMNENPDRSWDFTLGAEWASDLIHPDTDQ